MLAPCCAITITNRHSFGRCCRLVWWCFAYEIPLVNTLHYKTVCYGSLIYSRTYLFSLLPEQHWVWQRRLMLLRKWPHKQARQPVGPAPLHVVDMRGPRVSKPSSFIRSGAIFPSEYRPCHHLLGCRMSKSPIITIWKEHTIKVKKEQVEVLT